ncbi:uncharacterized protein LOC110860720 isoform X3 [Folsomia candida]|nr:uncharacterized protein LOC110860720 isoform X3 [Folsomia candida]XP_021965512.1 uncharacterized protein LOC110860720 isoform X3 [Folsomia candida]
MHPSRGRGGGRIVNQNLSKFTRLEETSAGRRRTTMQSVTNSRQSDTFEMSDGGADTTQEVHQLDTTYRVTRSGSRPPSSIHSHDSSSTSTTAVGGDSRAQRRRRQIPIIEEGEGDGLMFMTPTGNGNGIYPTTSRMTGDKHNLEDRSKMMMMTESGGWRKSTIAVYCSSGISKIWNFVTTLVYLVASVPVYVWSKIMRFVGLPIYWFLVQCLVSEKWVLDKDMREQRGDSRSRFQSSESGYFDKTKSWFAKLFSWWSLTSSSANSLVTNSSSSWFRKNNVVSESEEFLMSDDEGGSETEEWVKNKKTVNLNGGGVELIGGGEGGGKFHLNCNGHESFTPTTTGRVRELLQSTRARLFGNQFSNYSNQSGFVGRDRNTVVGMANLGTIAGWRKNLLVFWSPKTTSQRMTSSHQNNGLVSDDESEDEQGQVDVVFSDGWFTSGRICRVLAKLIALLLLLMGLLYLAYLLWPVAALIASKTLDASKQYGLAFLEGVSSLFALLVQLGSVFVASLQNFSSSLFVGRGSQKNVIIGEPAAFPIVTPIVTQQQQQQAAPPIPPPFFSKEDYERLLKRIEDLEAQLRLSDGQISEKDKLYNQEIIGIRQDYENNRKELDLMRNSIPTTASFEDEIEKQVKISCTKNCPEPEVPPSRPDPVVNFDDTNVQALIDRAIQKYDADKTGRPDLALESGGGSILNTRCTKSSKLRNSVVSFWGFKIWSPPNNPRTIIQPGVVPGDCWAFEGSVGDVVIKLVGPAVITGFTVEHISKLVSPYGNIDSAPNKFQVLGLNDVNDWEKAHDYGIYRYEDNGQTLQYFDVLNMTSTPYPIVELKIMSNHGNMHHTCLYRFRVHGHLADWLSTPFTSTVVTSSLPEESDTLHDEDVE